MRYAIATAPKNGVFVILEDDECGKYDVAQWSDEQGNWVGRCAEPVKIFPTHWHPLPRDEYFRDGDSEEPDIPSARSSISRIRPIVVGGACAAGAVLLLYVTGDPAQPELASTRAQLSSQEEPSAGSTGKPPARLPVNDELSATTMPLQGELRSLIDAEGETGPQQAQTRAEPAQATDITAAKRAAAALPEELSPGAMQHPQRFGGGAQQDPSADEVAIAQREIAVLEQRLRDAADQIGQFRHAGRMLVELQQSLQQEHDRAAFMVRDMDTMRLASCVLNGARQCEAFR